MALASGAALEDCRDWAGGLPAEVLGKVAGKVVAQTEAGWAAWRKEDGYSEEHIQWELVRRKRKGDFLFPFARVCKGWRKVQLKLGGRGLCSRATDVIPPGRVELVKWALAEGCPRTKRGLCLASAAAGLGHLELVQWLCGEGGFAMDKFLMRSAARSGNLELVQWLHANGCPWNFWTCAMAAHHGYLEVLLWLRASGCPWNAMTCTNAASGGHLEVLRWAREHGCYWDESACAEAAKGGHLKVLQWLRANGCPWDEWTSSAVFGADGCGTEGREVLRWARENGCPWTAYNRDRAAERFGYTDDLGNLVD